ncbi:hypothetical protein [Streptomyces sp. NPDC006739]|uniref:hypothetical protein n=1 Tax=Streptomyces sp. NPDC006739 TaxID=3364763 RepID=UPI0036A419CF
MHIDGMAQGCGCQLLWDVRDVFVDRGDDLFGEAKDGPGDTRPRRRARIVRSAEGSNGETRPSASTDEKGQAGMPPEARVLIRDARLPAPVRVPVKGMGHRLANNDRLTWCKEEPQ